MNATRFLCGLAVLALGAGLSLPAAAALPAAPAAKQIPVTDDYYGTKVVDPYRWMEDGRDPDLQAYLKVQNDRTHAILNSIPGRAALLGRVSALIETVTSSSNVNRRKGMFFYQKIAPGSSISKLYVRKGIGGAERVLVDPEALSAGGTHQAISWYLPSEDGVLVAVGLAAGGSENATMRIYQTATGKALSDRIDRTDFGATSWRSDGKAIYYTRRPALGPNASPLEKYRNIRTYLHVLGTDPERDLAVFGTGSPNVTIAPEDFAFAFITRRSPYAFGLVIHGVQREITAYIAPKSELAGGHAAWRKVADVADQITNFALHGDDIYLLSHKDAPRYKVVRTTAKNPDVANAVTVIPASDRVVDNLAAAKDA